MRCDGAGVRLSLPFGEPFGGFAQRCGQLGLVGGGIIEAKPPARRWAFSEFGYCWGWSWMKKPVMPIAQRLEV